MLSVARMKSNIVIYKFQWIYFIICIFFWFMYDNIIYKLLLSLVRARISRIMVGVYWFIARAVWIGARDQQLNYNLVSVSSRRNSLREL